MATCIGRTTSDILTQGLKYSNVEVSPDEATVSVHLILPSKDEVQNETIHLVTKTPAFVSGRAVPAGGRSHDRWVGILGLIVVAAILGLSAYSIVRYLW